MQPQTQSTLDVIYENWRGYQEKLRDCIAPLTREQLSLQPAAHLWPLAQIVQHMISARAGWFSGTLQDDDEAMQAYMAWGQRDSAPRSAQELAHGLDETWAFIEVLACSAGHLRIAPGPSRTNGMARCTKYHAVG